MRVGAYAPMHTRRLEFDFLCTYVSFRFFYEGNELIAPIDLQDNTGIYITFYANAESEKTSPKATPLQYQ